MNRESEAILERKLINQLVDLGYGKIEIKDEADIVANLRIQLSKHNQTVFSDKEFSYILNHLNKGNIFERSKILRDKMQLTRDNGDLEWIEFFDIDKWCKNIFQVAQQIEMEGRYKNRYDVTLLVNGLPLVQIELKRRGLELKEAFKQTKRYQQHSYSAGYGLFQYIQFFVISNGVNTKYYANNKRRFFKQTFYWSDKDNVSVTQLSEFTDIFLEPCHMSKMIAQYTVLNETERKLMVLRPYQYYAVESIIDRVLNSDKNGYIWHTTGSGKTLTSFKASQLLSALPEIKKIIFVVDRKDLDYQTIQEFNAYKANSADATDNTKALVKQLTDNTKLIVTTIQKLNNAVSYSRHQNIMEKLKNKRVVLIFDECHRSQFGETHAKIKNHFLKSQMFGFTGTPILAENAISKKTTKDLFDKQLHRYTITDAIKDENVLRFSNEYVGRYRQISSNNEIDIEVEAIDTKELMESRKRIEKIIDYILVNHDRKTHSKVFTAILCVNSIDVLIKYYELFQTKKSEGKHDLKVATIFSYGANQESEEDNELLEDDVLSVIESKKINTHFREKLDEFIDDYNKMFDTAYSTKDGKLYYDYYQNIAKRVRNQEIDILLVVNMFLTGFDSPHLNTLYVDKNLRYHGLIQAFSRTNRILNERKSHGNIVCFRNLKKNTDDAIALYSNKDAPEIIFTEPYSYYVDKFNEAIEILYSITPTVESVNKLPSEDDEMRFVQAFRNLLRFMNDLIGFSDFKFSDLNIAEQQFEDYKSKYLDIWDKVRTDTQKEQASILEDVDFEVELIHRDNINVAYILKLISKMNKMKSELEIQRQKEQILTLISSEVVLRSKQGLIKKFIDNSLPIIEDPEQVLEKFVDYWEEEKQLAFNQFCESENIDRQKLEEIIANFMFHGREPLNEEIANILNNKPRILKRRPIIERVKKEVMNLIDVFMVDTPDLETTEFLN
ncbi:MAG: type I restriction endonuclease subunit R [Candidatus Saccharibacteria bacterium]|nr:type I restriction endonuclease subunit R [Candidatus Saccharibacteria bacterium]